MDQIQKTIHETFELCQIESHFCIFFIAFSDSDDDASLLVGIHCLPCCSNDADDDDLPDSSQQDLIHSVIYDVDLQPEPFGSSISPVMKKSDEISEGRRRSSKKAKRKLDFGSSQPNPTLTQPQPNPNPKLDFGSSPRFCTWCW